jgi:eukaryotic-like serine/threonine-protein kinase
MREGPVPPFTPGQVLDGKYRVEGTLGESGLAIVLLATQIELERTVAVKLLQSAARTRQELVDRFERDARLAARMKNDHVVRVHDVAVCEHGPYMVMEYLEGKDLAELVAEEGRPLAVERVVGLVIEACEGLAEAHAMGYLHGDIRPTNLFLAKRPGTPILKIISVGISGSAPVHEGASGWADSPGGGAGALAYMAPERLALGGGVDMRGDIWSLGVVLYELLTGRRPFEGATASELCESIARARPVPPIALRPEVPLELQGVLLQCLEKGPDDRWPSVGHLSHALAPFAKTAAPRVVVQGGVTEAAPPRPRQDSIEVKIEPRAPLPDPRRSAKTLILPDRKRRRARTSGALALAAGLVLAAGLLVWATHARRARRAMVRPVAPPATSLAATVAPPPVPVEPEPLPPAPAASSVAAAAPPPSAPRPAGRRLPRPASARVDPPAAAPPPSPPAPTATDPRASFGERQ